MYRDPVEHRKQNRLPAIRYLQVRPGWTAALDDLLDSASLRGRYRTVLSKLGGYGQSECYGWSEPAGTRIRNRPYFEILYNSYR